MTRLSNAVIALVLGPCVGAAVPLIELALDCRVPTSDACLWGKGLLPLTLTLGAVPIGGVLALVFFALLEWWRPKKPQA